MPARLTPGQRAGRTAFTLVVGVLLTAGTVWGTDDAWPFAPFRMFAASTSTDGAVAVAAIEVRGPDGGWEPAELEHTTVGMTRAEVEAQLPRLRDDPALLGHLADAHDRLHPEEPAWEALRIVQRATVVADGAPTGEERTTVVAEWQR